MHELLLFGQVSSSQHEHVLSILAGIAAMQPQFFLEKRLVFEPRSDQPGLRLVETGTDQCALHPGIQELQTKMQGDRFYLQFAHDVDTTSASREHGQGYDGLKKGEPSKDKVRSDSSQRYTAIRSYLTLDS